MNKKLSKIALDILGIILALICLSPFYIIIVNSFKTKGELFESTLALPEKFNLDNYTRAWEQLDFIKVLGNSLFITVISIVFIVLFASMAAWMLQRTNSKISNMILFIFISSMETIFSFSFPVKSFSIIVAVFGTIFIRLFSASVVLPLE